MIRFALALAAAVAAVLAFALVGCGDNAPPSRFVPGQAWSYAARDGDEGSRVLVLKVERRGTLGIVIHVAVDGLRLANPRGATATERVIPVIAHIPMRAAALEASVLELLDEHASVPPDWERAYAQWDARYRTRKASAYAKPLREVVTEMAEALVQ